MAEGNGQPLPVLDPEKMVVELKGFLYDQQIFEKFIPPDFESKIRINFKLFDRNKDGYLNMEEINALLVSIDISLDPFYVKTFYEYLAEEEKGVNEEDFFLFVIKKLKDEDKEAELLNFFKVLDPEGKGRIDDLEAFKDLLMSKGLRMSEEDADALLEVLNPKGAQEFEYGDFCKILTSKGDDSKKKKKGKKESKKKG